MNSAIAADKADLAFALFVASLAFLSWAVRYGNEHSNYSDHDQEFCKREALLILFYRTSLLSFDIDQCFITAKCYLYGSDGLDL